MIRVTLDSFHRNCCGLSSIGADNDLLDRPNMIARKEKVKSLCPSKETIT